MERTQSNKQPTTNQVAIPGNRDGVFWQFITEKLNSYTPPTRKGTPRGESVGYPSDKYLAALLHALMGASMKEIAEEFAISYDLLRKWSTESEFKELGLKFREEFTERFIQQFRSRYEDNTRRWNEHFAEEVKKVLNRTDTEEQWQKDLEELGLQDSRLYSPGLLSDIYNRFKAEVSEGGTSVIFFWLNVANMLLVSSHCRSHYPLWKMNEANLRHASITQLQRTKALLRSREEATPEDSQSHIYLLDQVQRFLEWPPIN